MSIEQWRIHEIEMHAAEIPKNPMTDADIWGVFTHSDGTRIRIPAFWNGEDRYFLRFAPTKIGKWNYQVEASPESLKLDGLTGTLECVPYEGNEEIFKHGFLKKGPRGRLLVHQDDTPFFWLGDTHWSFVTQEQWDQSNAPFTDSQFRFMVDKRKEQHFTVYQCNLHCGYDKGAASWLAPFAYFEDTENGYLPVLSVFQENMDLKMNYLADHGFVIALGFTWYSNIDAPGAIDYYKMVARYIIARYGAYPIVWTLAGEVAGYNGKKRQTYIDGWREIALEIERLDGYGSLQTCHYTNERPLADYYQDESWFDFTLNQCGHADLPIHMKVYKDHFQKYPLTPFVEGEALYDGLTTIEDLERREVTARMVRIAAYTAMQSGACGYTYGAQGCWNAQWGPVDSEDPHAFTFWGSYPWYEGIFREGANSMKIMRDFYESIGWHRLSPMYNCVELHNLETSEQLLIRSTPPVMTDPETDVVTAYYKTNAKDALRLKGLSKSFYKMQWFNPEEGTYMEISEKEKTVNGSLEIPAKPDEKDWMLLLTAIKE